MAWLHVVSESHVELLERELTAAARAFTGYPVSTPRDSVTRKHRGKNPEKMYKYLAHHAQTRFKHCNEKYSCVLAKDSSEYLALLS